MKNYKPLGGAPRQFKWYQVICLNVPEGFHRKKTRCHESGGPDIALWFHPVLICQGANFALFLLMDSMQIVDFFALHFKHFGLYWHRLTTYVCTIFGSRNVAHSFGVGYAWQAGEQSTLRVHKKIMYIMYIVWPVAAPTTFLTQQLTF